MKSRMIFLSSMAIGLGLLFGGTGVTAQAVMTNDQILQTAPKGVRIDDYFSTGNITGNAAQISDTGFGKRQAVNLTNGPNQAGAIWASDAARMNLKEDQTVSMWMYFGDGRFSSSNSGDGMAFVLQNDSNGVNAIAKKADGTPASGQSMGVWGTDSRTDMTKSVDTSAIARLAIQNSWAVEFDTTLNRDIQDDLATALAKGPMSDFDWTVHGPHVASNFPGQATTYQSNQVTNYYYTSMVHEGLLEVKGKAAFTFLDAGWWRHVTLKWDSFKHTMTYSYNDRTPVAGEEPLSATSAETQKQTFTSSVKIDPAKDLNVGSDGLVRWGFTGSTGSASSSQKLENNLENNILVFDQVPGLVDADVTASLVDNSQGNKNIDDASDVVYTGDQMTLRYHLNYKSGRDSWQNIQYKLNLPGGIEYSSAKITYDDGKQATGNDSETVNIKGQSVSETLARNLSNNTDAGETNGATITLTGIATSSTATASSPENIASTTSSFEGTNAITQATLNGFQIKRGGDGTMTMALTGSHITPDKDDQEGSEDLTTASDVTVTGEIKYRTVAGAPVAGKTLTVLPRYNGTSISTPVLATDDDGDGIYQFSYTIPASDLNAGSENTNTLELFATDTATHLNATNNLVYKVTLKDGTKSISADPKSSFNTDHPQNMTGAAMRLQPDSNWSVKVYDSIGKGDHWTLQASATPLMSRLRGFFLDGDLSYIDADHNVNSLTQGLVNIETHTTTSDDDVVDISGSWNDSRGLFLDVNPEAVEGQYMSQITWTFGDVENVS